MRRDSFAVVTPASSRTRFVTAGALACMIDQPPPDIGETFAYTAFSPWGTMLRWQKVEGGLTEEELIDSNVAGELVMHLVVED